MSPPAQEGEYLWANQDPSAGLRFESLAALFNANTFRHLETLGIAEGWRCWEVGVGGPSIPTWLSERVGASGHVVATDIDIRWAKESVAPSVEVLERDVAADEPPSGAFDLVHERLVLLHVTRRDEALRRMIGALRPGAWLLVEDFDSLLQPFACPDVRGAKEERANKIRASVRGLLAQRGVDLEFGRKLPRLLRAAGLVDVAADAYGVLAQDAGRRLDAANMQQSRDGLIAAGDVTADEIDAHAEALRAGTIDVATPTMISAWGRKP